jgi:uncharacterized protein (DUF427 family)
MKAIFNGQILAESNETIVIENNHYFPASSIHKEYFKDSETSTFCSWKGDASYYTINVNGEINADAAWYYANPMEKALEIKDYIAFWKGIEVTE